MTAETQPQSPSGPTAPAGPIEEARPLLKRIILRFAALVLLIVAANAWVIFQFDVNVTKLVLFQLAIAAAAGVRKKLLKRDDQAIDRFLRRALYSLLGTRFLVIAWLLFLSLTSFLSVATVTAPDARTACVAGNGNECHGPLVAGDDRSLFLLPTTPMGRQYEARLGTRKPASFTHSAWRASALSTAHFKTFPSVLLRIEYPHLDIEGGRIEIRDAASKQVLAAVGTTAESAAMLVGPAPELTDALLARWDHELTAAGVTFPSAKAARIEAWRKFVRAEAAAALPSDRALEAVFRNDGQLNAGDHVAARSAPFRLGDAGLQDIVIERVPQ